MKNWKDTLISPSTIILRAIEIIDAVALQIALVIDEDGRLLGTVTDGDIRRGILKGISLNDPVERIMYRYPTTVSPSDGRQYILEMMKLKKHRLIPVVDESARVIGIESLDELIESPQHENWVVIMAGGMGTRLYPLTDDCPKPLLKVGDKPILETIMKNFMEYGFRRFYFSVNYKADMIENYFKDGSRWGAEIHYINEDKRMGTAGALSLLPEKPRFPIFVMNGDLLTKVNFQRLLNFHLDHRAEATMCIREFNFQVPYGVVKVAKHHLLEIEEKPVQRFFVSAGIYVIEPEALDVIPKNSFFDMPELFDRLIAENRETIAFPIREYWLDIGRIADYEQANGDYREIFKIHEENNGSCSN